MQICREHEFYELGEMLGEGRYSKVYKGIDVETKQEIVAKRLLKIRHSRVQIEVLILQHLRGTKNNI